MLQNTAKLLGFKPELRLTGPVHTLVSDDVREHLLAVLAEALSNIVRHAGASHVAVAVDVSDDIALTVRDDGRGIAAGRPGNGLRNIRERAVLMGGTSEVVSEAPGGTLIRWRVPRREI
ncbi:sensor histidine kinase [Aeromicrobium sp. UC242_57]|uniref:sensor histidine kinase n=1 Tax=Aeromicrobium sp. UC242_57 TaxID=3374624 RepID=UPI0037877778